MYDLFPVLLSLLFLYLLQSRGQEEGKLLKVFEEEGKLLSVRQVEGKLISDW